MSKSVSIFACVLLTFLNACGIPADLEKRSRNYEDQIKQARTQLNQHKEQFSRFQSSGEFKFFAPYAEREKWAHNFARSDQAISEAESVYRGEVSSFLRQDKKEDVPALERSLTKIARHLGEASSAMREPFRRKEVISQARTTAPALIQEVRRKTPALLLNADPLRTSVDKATKDFPQKVPVINGKAKPVLAQGDSVTEALATANREFARHEAGTADYALFSDAVTYIRRKEALPQEQARVRKEIGQLYTSYSRILDDMKADYYVTVGRTSWDESSDFNTDKDYVYQPVKVDEETFEYFSGLAENAVLATHSNGWLSSGTRVSIDQKYWDALRINPEENFSGNSAEYWLEETELKGQHKYTDIVSGKKVARDWVAVDEDDYEENVDNLGMEIVSKPYGSFESEVVEVATPPGLSYVGNSHYGQWNTDSQGRSFWHWYGQYAFFSNLFDINRPYYRTEWDHWNRNYRGRREYYGMDERRPTYGSYGMYTRATPRYQTSAFSRTGGFRSAASGTGSSLRGAGPGMRGRGPGGGGK